MFKKGDRVGYILQKASKGWNPRRSGHTGTVLWSDEEETRVRWDKEFIVSGIESSTHYTANFQLSELRYDPEQQGDTDDDI